MRNWLIDMRKYAKMTQAEVADKAIINRAHYARIESGKRRPSVETAKRIAGIFNFDWNRFFPDINSR